jgi:hypothetical protein
MLQYVQELGCVFDEWATKVASGRGDLEALRYLNMCGAPWNDRTLTAAVGADSLPCLTYAHSHGCPQADNEAEFYRWLRAHSLPVLRYVCEHMGPAFAPRVLKNTAEAVLSAMDWGKELDWPRVLYLARKWGGPLPKGLAYAKATLTKRAATLAGVFWMAGRQLYAEPTRLLHRKAGGGEEDHESTDTDAERMALWDAMARVPTELVERIAVEAHLIML